MNAKNFKFSPKRNSFSSFFLFFVFFICPGVGMHENILHNFLFKNFIFLVSLVILVRDFVLSRCLLSLRLTRRSKVNG